MIRKVALGMSLLAITAGSAFAAPAKQHHVNASPIAAEANAPAADTTAPAADKAEKKTKKSSKKDKADKGAAKTDAAKEIKAPAPEPLTK